MQQQTPPDAFDLAGMVADLNSLLCLPNGMCATHRGGIALRPDGTHFVGQGAQIVTRMLAPQMGLGNGGRS